MFGQVREKNVDVDSLFSNYALFYYLALKKVRNAVCPIKEACLLLCKDGSFWARRIFPKSQ